MTAYCAYLRKSRADREAERNGAEETLARHKQLLTELSQKKQKPISRFYTEIVSGETISNRPVMQQLLTDVEAGMWSGVYVVEIERLARGNTKDQGIVAEAFKYSGTIIITPTKIYDPDNEFDEEYFEFGLFMSRREYKTINRRLLQGRMASVKEGNFLGGTPPYGYKKVHLSKGCTLAIIPEQAEIVKQIFNWYCYGQQQPDGSFHRLGANAIASKLNLMGVKPPAKDKWSKATISGMLKNLTYTGKVFFGQRKEIKASVNGNIVKKRIYDSGYLIAQGKHPAIIEEELFSLAQKLRSLNRKSTTPACVSLQNPLSGIVRCKKCGACMTRLAPNSRNKYATLKCPNPSCDNISSPLYLVEKQILQFLREWLKAYEIHDGAASLKKPFTDEIRTKQKELEKLDLKLTVLSSQLEHTYDLLEQGVYSIDVFHKRQTELDSSLIALKEKRQAAEKDLQNYYDLIKMQEQYAPEVHGLLEHYERNTAEINHEILRQLVDQVLYEKRKKNTRGNLENCNFTLEIYPHIPS